MYQLKVQVSIYIYIKYTGIYIYEIFVHNGGIFNISTDDLGISLHHGWLEICDPNQGAPRHFGPCSLWPKAWRFSVVFRVGKLEFFSKAMEIPIFNRKYIFKWWIFYRHVSFRGCALPETSSFRPENGWLEYFFVSFGEKGLFSGANC